MVSSACFWLSVRFTILLVYIFGLTGFSAWGGKQYTWSSAQVIATLVIGIVTLICFVLYGTYKCCWYNRKSSLITG